MCDLHQDGYGTTFSDQTRKARKQHVCDECWRKIGPGEPYGVVVGEWEGDFFTCKFCSRCNKARLWLQARGHGWTGGQVISDVRYCVESDGPEILEAHRSQRAAIGKEGTPDA